MRSVAGTRCPPADFIPAMDPRGPKTADLPDRRTVLVVEDDDAARAFLIDNLAYDGLASRIDPDLPVIVLSGRAS
jgi:hypothetical protein